MAASQESRSTSLVMYILSIFFGFIPSLVMYFVKKDDSFVHEQATELLNFEITAIIAYVVLMLLAHVIGSIAGILILVLGVVVLVLLIMGAIKVNKGESYTFPFALRLVK